MDEKITGKQLTYLTDLEERDRCAQALRGKLETGDVHLPVFDRWTLIDAETHRIYATFHDASEIAAYIAHPLFSTMMEMIIRNRQLGVYISEEDRVMRVKLNQYATIQFVMGDVVVHPSHTVDGVPTRWTIGITGSQWLTTEMETQKLIETGFDIEALRKAAEHADFAF